MNEPLTPEQFLAGRSPSMISCAELNAWKIERMLSGERIAYKEYLRQRGNNYQYRLIPATLVKIIDGQWARVALQGHNTLTGEAMTKEVKVKIDSINFLVG